jgi:hypothetical protein
MLEDSTSLEIEARSSTVDSVVNFVHARVADDVQPLSALSLLALRYFSFLLLHIIPFCGRFSRVL